MKLEQNTFQDVVLGAESEQKFEIASDNSVVFEILRDKMYSDKIGAVCREVSSNARDANRENGVGNNPITIRLIKPNEAWSIADLSIVFQDEGVGIDPDRMSDVFLRYGDSTKRATNEQTGGFGLGAKTPFAYSDTFTVITVCDYKGKRIKYTYTAMIDSTRVGKMILFDQDETEEPTGTKIVVPISEDDRGEFEKKVLTATLLWDVRPDYAGFEMDIPEVEYIYECENFKVVNNIEQITKDKYGYEQRNRFFRKNSTALIDGIPYALDTNQVDVYRNPFSQNDSYLMCYTFDNGSLTIAANREQLQYDNRTTEIIEARAIESMQHIEESFETLVNASPSYLSTCLLVNSLNGQIESDSAIVKLMGARQSTSRRQFTYNGIHVRRNLTFKHFKIYSVYDNSNTFDIVDSKRNEVGNLVIDNYLKEPIVFFDTRKDSRRDATLFEAANEKIGKRAYHAIERATPVWKVNERNNQDDVLNHERAVMYEMLEIANLFELKFNFYSDVEKVDRSVSANTVRYKKEPKVDVQVKRMTRNGLVADTIQVTRKTLEADLDIDKSIIVVTVDSIAENKIYLGSSVREKLKDLVAVGYLVYLCQSRNSKKYFEENPAILDWNTEYNKFAKEKQEEAQESLNAKAIYEEISSSSYRSPRRGFESGVVEHLKEYLPTKSRALYAKYGKNIHDRTSTNELLNRVGQYLMLKGIVPKNLKRKISAEKAMFSAKYPMLKYITNRDSWGGNYEYYLGVTGEKRHQVKDAKDYIESVNSCTNLKESRRKVKKN